MSETTDDNQMAAFGANEWLVDEMRERYEKDRNSVDKAWWAFFEGSQPVASPPAADPVANSTPGRPEPHAPTASTPVAQPSAPVATNPNPPASPVEPPKATAPAQGRDPEPKKEALSTEEPSYTVLRGAPARTAANMDASLTVPTATSVRSVPVKLL